MKNTITIACLLILCTITSNAQVVDSINPNINSRFEYVHCRLESSYAFDDEYFYFSSHLKSLEDGKIYKVFIGAKTLFRFLYPEIINPNNDLLFASVGKMLIYDTINLSKQNIDVLFKRFGVNELKLQDYINNGFLINYQSAIDYYNQNIDCMDNEMGYYFDRLYFPAGSYHSSTTSICEVDFEYSCGKSLIPVPYYDEKNNTYKAYKFNEKGELLSSEDIK